MLVYPIALVTVTIIIVSVTGVYVLSSRRRAARLANLGDKQLIQRLLGSVDFRRRQRRIALWCGTVMLVGVALARPVWGIAEQTITAEGIAIIVVLDVSTSMDAQDIQPSRLDRAKLTARALFEASTDNQVGLVLFAGNAFVQFPLTTDTRSAITFLDAANTTSISRQGTAVEDALRLALDTVDERIASQSVIVLMTDGENHQGVASRAANEAQDRGVIIHVIGYGTEGGATIPVIDNQGQVIGAKTDRAGNVVLTQLDEEPLIEIAEITGGLYRRADVSGIEVIDLLNAIREVEQVTLDERLQIRQIDRFAVFVLLALILLTFEIASVETRRST